MKKKNSNRKGKKARRPTGHSIGVGISQSVYTEVLRLATYNLNITAEQQWPVILRFGPFAAANERLMSLCTNFQQYKVVNFQVHVVPVVRSGNYPPPLYMLTGLDRELSPIETIVIQTGHLFSNSKPSSHRVAIAGRQNDMNYWFDCEKVGTADKRPTIQWSFVADTYQSTVLTGVYQLSITAKFLFRFPQYDTPALLKALASKQKPQPEPLKEDEVREEEKEEVEENKSKEEKIAEIEEKISQLRASLVELKTQA